MKAVRISGPLAGTDFAEVGKVKAPLPVEDEIVRTLQRHLAGGAIEAFDGAGREVDPLDSPAGVILGL